MVYHPHKHIEQQAEELGPRVLIEPIPLEKEEDRSYCSCSCHFVLVVHVPALLHSLLDL